MGNWLVIPKGLGGYSFGVEAEGPTCFELHGGYRTWEEAHDHLRYLGKEYSDYISLKVVKIETPEVNCKGEK